MHAWCVDLCMKTYRIVSCIQLHTGTTASCVLLCFVMLVMLCVQRSAAHHNKSSTPQHRCHRTIHTLHFDVMPEIVFGERRWGFGLFGRKACASDPTTWRLSMRHHWLCNAVPAFSGFCQTLSAWFSSRLMLPLDTLSGGADAKSLLHALSCSKSLVFQGQALLYRHGRMIP